MPINIADNDINPFLLLPDELKYQICTSLTGLDLASRVALVCRDLNGISNDERLWEAETKRTFNRTEYDPKPGFWKERYLSLTNTAFNSLVKEGKSPPQELANNKDFMLQAVKQNCSILKFASVELRNDREILLAAGK